MRGKLVSGFGATQPESPCEDGDLGLLGPHLNSLCSKENGAPGLLGQDFLRSQIHFFDHLTGL